MATTIIDFIPGINQLKLAKKDDAALINEARKAAREIARLEPEAPPEEPRSPGTQAI